MGRAMNSLVKSLASEPPLASQNGLPPRHQGVAVAAVLAAMVLVVLDAAIVNVALPALARDLHVTAATSLWIVTSYQLALVVALLPCAALGESVGYRRIFTSGVAVFTVASVLCALAPSFPWLFVGRFLQGLGGAAVMALGVALFRFIVPHQKLGAVIGWNALAVALSSAAGPTIGAAILSVSSWHWLFALNLPVGIVVLFATRALPRPNGTGRRLDVVSVSLNAAGLASLVLGADLAPTSPMVAVILFAVAALSLTRLVRREISTESPLIPIDLLRGQAFRFSVIASALCFAGQTAGLVALTFYLQNGLGQDVFTTGLYMTVWPLTVAFAAPFVGRLSTRISANWLCFVGGTLLATGLGFAALWPLHQGPFALIPFTMLCGLGFSLFNVPNNRTMFMAAPLERSGAAGGMQGSARLLGQTTGAVAMTLLFTLVSMEMAPRIGLILGAALTLAAAVASTLQRESDSASRPTGRRSRC
jgi:MFS transporter, DHA2 family, multidrug resistance protein